MVVNSTRTESGPKLARYLQYAQKNVTVYIEPSGPNYPTFMRSSYNINILANTAANTCILSIPYKFTGTLPISVQFEQRSTSKIEQYFNLKYNNEAKMVYLYMKPLYTPIDLSDINFVMRFQNIYAVNPQNTSTKISIGVLSPSNLPANFNFKKPEIANKFVVIHINLNWRFNQIIYEFEVNKPSQKSVIAYKILNPEFYMLQIENNFLRIIYPFSSLDDFKRSNYLVSTFI